MDIDELKKLLKKYEKDLKNNNLDPIFQDEDAFEDYFYTDIGLSPDGVKKFLEDQGIDPLKYVTRIPTCYYDDEKLDNLNLSKYTNLKTVGQSAFSGCYIDKDLILPNSIEVIGYDAFWLEVSNLYLPDSLKEVDPSAFDSLECDSIIYKSKKYNKDNILQALEDNGVNISQ